MFSFPFPDPEARPDGCHVREYSEGVHMYHTQGDSTVQRFLRIWTILSSRRYSCKTRRFLLTGCNQFFCELPPRKLKKWWTEEKKCGTIEGWNPKNGLESMFSQKIRLRLFERSTFTVDGSDSPIPFLKNLKSRWYTSNRSLLISQSMIRWSLFSFFLCLF